MLTAGTHIALSPEPEVTRRAADAFIAPSLLTQLITRDFGRSELTLIPGSNPLLIRANPETTARLKEVLLNLDSAGDALNIQVQAVLSADLRSAEEGKTAQGASSWTAGCRSGDALSLGTQTELHFIGGFAPEVATDAATADPLSSSALYGETLYLTCSRVRNGSAVHIEGLLDLAYHTQTETFDPDTPDLGMVQQPQIRFLQVAFSGVASPGRPVVVELKGAPTPIGDRKLTITATTSPDPEAASSGWSLRDLAFIGSAGHTLEAAQPGLGRDGQVDHAHATQLTPMSPGSLAGLLIDRSSLGSEPSRVQATSRLLLIPASNKEALLRTDELVAALESELLREHTLTLSYEGLSVTAPTTHGRALRIMHGAERPYLVGYSSEIAPNSWIPTPISEVAFDGVCLTARSKGGDLNARWWSAKTQESRTIGDEIAHTGALQQLTRTFNAGAAQVEAGSEISALLKSSTIKITYR
jgi:hypothetical protein